jgi:hypothetical protein
MTHTLLLSLRRKKFGSLANARKSTGICPSSLRHYEIGFATPIWQDDDGSKNFSRILGAN